MVLRALEVQVGLPGLVVEARARRPSISVCPSVCPSACLFSGPAVRKFLTSSLRAESRLGMRELPCSVHLWTAVDSKLSASTGRRLILGNQTQLSVQGLLGVIWGLCEIQFYMLYRNTKGPKVCIFLNGLHKTVRVVGAHKHLELCSQASPCLGEHGQTIRGHMWTVMCTYRQACKVTSGSFSFKSTLGTCNPTHSSPCN